SLLRRPRRRPSADAAALPRNGRRHFRVIQQPGETVGGGARCLGKIADVATAGPFIVERKLVWRRLDTCLVPRSLRATGGCGGASGARRPVAGRQRASRALQPGRYCTGSISL